MSLLLLSTRKMSPQRPSAVGPVWLIVKDGERGCPQPTTLFIQAPYHNHLHTTTQKRKIWSTTTFSSKNLKNL